MALLHKPEILTLRPGRTCVASGPKTRPTPRASLVRSPGSATGSLHMTSVAIIVAPMPLGSMPPCAKKNPL